MRFRGKMTYGTLTIDPVVLYQDKARLSPRWPAPTRFKAHLGLSTITTCNYLITLGEHDCNFTDIVNYFESFCCDVAHTYLLIYQLYN